MSDDDLIGDTRDELLKTAELADLLGLSTPALSRLIAEDVLHPVKIKRANYYRCRASVRAYCQHLRDAATGRAEKMDPAGHSAEKLRLTKAQAEKTEIQNAKARGELIEVETVAHKWRSQIIDLRSRLLAIPSRVAARTGMNRHKAAELDVELREALEAIADGH